MADKLPKLRKPELDALQALKSGSSEVEAYQVGYPHTLRYKIETVTSQAARFFLKPRIQSYLNRDLPAKQEEVLKNLGGHPTSYRPRYIQKLIEYFGKDPIDRVSKEIGETGEFEVIETINPLPTRAGFACLIGVPSSTIKGWCHITNDDGELRYPEFANAYKLARDYQQNILVQNTLGGHYNPAFAKFTAQNLLDWSDKRDVVITDESKPKTLINIHMTAEEAAEIYLTEMRPAIEHKP